MDLAQMKAAVTMEGVLSGTAALELIAEVERLTARLVEYKQEAQKSCRRENDLKTARDRAEQQVKDLTALCDGYRGEMEELKANHPERVYMLRAEKAESALTRARAEGMEEAAKVVDAECARVLACQTGKQDLMNLAVDQNIRMCAVLLPDIAAAIRERATKGDSDEG